MNASRAQAVDVLFGMLQPQEIFDNPRNLTTFNTETIDGYFEDYRGWSGTDHWVVAVATLPTYIKPPSDKAEARGAFPKLYSLIGDCCSDTCPRRRFTKPNIEHSVHSNDLVEIFTEQGLEIAKRFHLQAVEQLVEEMTGRVDGRWLHWAAEHTLVYQLDDQITGLVEL